MAAFLPTPQGEAPADLALRKLVALLERDGEVLPAAGSPLGLLWKALHQGDESSVEECAKIISIDPALTNWIFRLANSAAIGGRAATIHEAVLFLGLLRVRQVAIGAGVLDKFAAFQLPPAWSQFWLRNLFIARVVDHLAAHYFKTDGSEYLAGLLHDSSWLFLATHFPDEFAAILTAPGSRLDAEVRHFSVNHAHLSAALCLRSHLPLRVIDAVLHHPQPQLLDPTHVGRLHESALFLSVLLHLSARIADACQINRIKRTPVTFEQIAGSAEAKWLAHFGPAPDFVRIATSELPIAEEVHAMFFEG
ncbi:HDOD domain-containing protein [Verrucomicrobium sp. GAS474]|uniref:HDOD domain-containing protein n=1 Tax=Verrucomicrobium sp. GAS474 TaxID=1882831 RepID=UPI0012FF8C58|nr:HDOD domain-containing protein [Verrucomicrobium sp. GAS474]